MDKSDAQLVEEYKQGNEESLKILIFRYMKSIYSFTYRLSGNAEEAHDLTQETFLKAWKNLKKYDIGKRFHPWILAIARNTTIDWLRKKRPSLFSEMAGQEDETSFEENIIDQEALQDELFEKKENEEIIEQALKNIPIDSRSVILLHIEDALTFEEIADIVRKPMNTVKSQYRRGLKLIKKYFELHQKS